MTSELSGCLIPPVSYCLLSPWTESEGRSTEQALARGLVTKHLLFQNKSEENHHRVAQETSKKANKAESLNPSHLNEALGRSHQWWHTMKFQKGAMKTFSEDKKYWNMERVMVNHTQQNTWLSGGKTQPIWLNPDSEICVDESAMRPLFPQWGCMSAVTGTTLVFLRTLLFSATYPCITLRSSPS